MVARYGSAAASAALAAAFAAIAFIGKGGNELGALTTLEIVLIVGCGLVTAVALAYGRDLRHGRVTLLLFGALAALTALSVLWSIAPDLSWVEANRTFMYFAVFAAGVTAGRLVPRSYGVVLRGLLGAIAVVIVYALASRIWPETFGGSTEIYARIGEPYGYWNAVGVTAAIGVVPALWLGARRSGNQQVNALAYPLLALLYIAMFLAYSRGALITAAIGVLIWFVVVPLRLRSLPVFAIPAIGAAPVLVWALGKPQFTQDNLLASQRATAGPEFGLLLLAVSLILLAIGLAIGFQESGWAPSFRLRRRSGVIAVAIALLMPLVLVTSLAFSSRGLTGTVSQQIKELTSESAVTPGGPQRLIHASSTRGRYWRQAAHVFHDQPVTGSGAGTFGLARLRYRKDQLVVQHAHGFVAQTASDLGVLGLIAIFALAGAWIISAARTVGLERNADRRDGAPRWWDADRVGMAALAIAALVFGIHSAIDWTWFVPGPAIMAIAVAGFVAGRAPAPLAATEGASVVAAGPWSRHTLRLARLPRLHFRLPPRPHASRLLTALLAAITALLVAWAAYQPYRSDTATNQSFDLLGSGKLAAAQAKAQAARSYNPASLRPIWAQAAIAVAQKNLTRAEVLYQRALFKQPSNPEAWTRLAEFELYRNNQPQRAIDVVSGALYLDPRSAPAQTVFFDARRRLLGEP